MELFGFAFFLVPLLIIGLIVWGIVSAVRRPGATAQEPGIGSVRRLFFYGLAFIALMLATLGLTLIVGRLIGLVFLDEIARRGSGQFAFGIAATIVGFPVWALLWRAAQRSIDRYAAERGTLGRKVYVYLVLFVAAAVVALNLTRSIGSALEGSAEALAGIGPVLVWGGLWFVHWRWETAEGQPTGVARSTRRLYAYLTSTYGLVLLAVGAGLLLASLLGTAYDRVFGGAFIGPGPGVWNEQLRGAIAPGLVGALWWWFHWHRLSADDADSLLRQIVIYIVAIFGGVITVIGATAVALFTTFEWVLDRPALTGAAVHFDGLPAAFVTALVAGGVWGYHRTVVFAEAEAAGTRLVSARRAYRYLTAAVGLGTLAVGLTVLFAVAIGLLVPGAQGVTLVGQRWWGTPLSLALTLTLVGAPVWVRYWLRQQGEVRAGGAAERQALSRRTFIFVVFGVAVLATLASGSTFLFMLLDAAFESRLSSEVLDGGKWALGTTLTAGVLSFYHWQVLKEDRAAAPEPEVAPAAVAKQVTAVAGPRGSALVDAIAAAAGAVVTTWARQDDAG
ncbi:MAG: hypothetical protein IH869_00395, partial [Chloroflexi bacterium]|nr:hypothetical protein [Chloroflexota bacterium]